MTDMISTFPTVSREQVEEHDYIEKPYEPTHIEPVPGIPQKSLTACIPNGTEVRKRYRGLSGTQRMELTWNS